MRWLPHLLALTAFAALASPAAADDYIVYLDDRAAFSADLALLGGTSVIDSAGAFAPDPVPGTSFTSVLRSGVIGGDAFGYTAYDVDFANAPPGTLSPGVAGGDIADTDRVAVELPAAQSGAVGTGSWGLDSGSGGTTTRNALLVDFTLTPGSAGVGHFGLDLLDFEASAAYTSGELRLYDAGLLVFVQPFAWGGAAGNGESHFLGVAAVNGGGPFFDQVAVVLGDDSAGGGGRERWAADRITFGQSVVNPEPATFWLLAVGGVGLVLVRRRARAARRA